MDNQDILGSGLDFPLRRNASGQIARSNYSETVRQSIWLILSTAPGERVMRPEFGCRIQDEVYSLNTPGTLGRVERDVEQALVLWEPRINLMSVSASYGDDAPNRMYVHIEYTLRSNNSRHNLVYPFYLE